MENLMGCILHELLVGRTVSRYATVSFLFESGGKRMADYFHAQRVSAATEIIHKVIPALHDPGHTRVFESFLPLVFFIKT